MKDYNVKVLSNTALTSNVFEMKLLVEGEFTAKVGQFINLSTPSDKQLLRRPFCVADYDENSVTIIYQVVGEGTKLLSTLKEGATLKALIGLGNGFDLDAFGKIMVVAGGMGVAVFPSIFRTCSGKEIYTFMGFNSKNQVIKYDFMKERSKEIFVATADGSEGYKGFVTDLAREEYDRIKPDVIVACGPEPMFKSLKKTFAGVDIPIFISMERRMGCGIGACLVCNCKVKINGKEDYLRACKDGPVFNAWEVDLDD